ncbi:MAG: peptidoglycan-binding protein [Acidimicrobiales bacterium]|nr:peptidoglycan-binding protein [Acidimicrobiales bacterium]MCB9372347.1 peptidoglycan-binding protein [Microthrixaceae bacterium]
MRDLQGRLTAVGHDCGDDPLGTYGAGTEAAVRRFQEARGLHVDGVCGQQTWSALVEAGYRLGDRLLYHRTPLLRGDDVHELQQRLGALGFDAGRVDGFFGPNSASALKDFQQNVGLTSDGICGPDTLAALHRLGGAATGVAAGAGAEARTEAEVREGERLRHPGRSLAGQRVVVGEFGGLDALAGAVARSLGDEGAVVVALHHPDGSVLAADANAFDAEVYVGLSLRPAPQSTATFYASPGFESVGGRHLAELAAERVCGAFGPDRCAVRGMRLPILRETRMPAIQLEIGEPSLAVEGAAELVAALVAAVVAWAGAPLDG